MWNLRILDLHTLDLHTLDLHTLDLHTLDLPMLDLYTLILRMMNPVAYLGFQKGGAKCALATRAHTKGGQTKFSNFFTMSKKIFGQRGPWRFGQGVNTPLVEPPYVEPPYVEPP